MRCVCVWLGRRGGEGGEWMGGIPVGTEGVLYVSLDCGGEWVGGLDQGLEGVVVLCLCEM